MELMLCIMNTYISLFSVLLTLVNNEKNETHLRTNNVKYSFDYCKL